MSINLYRALERAIELEKLDKKTDGLDLMIDKLDEVLLLEDGGHDRANKFLEDCEIQEASITLMLSMLTITNVWRNKLLVRPGFCKRVREELVRRGESKSRIDSLISGLE